MKKLITLLMLAGLLFVWNACGEKSRLDKLQDLVEEVQKEGADYTAEQWEAVNEEFKEVMDELGSYSDLTDEEIREIGRLQGEYAGVAVKNSGKRLQKGMQKAGEAIEGFFEGLGEGLKDKDKE